MDDNRVAIVTFDVDKVAGNKELMLSLFFEMDGGLDMGSEFKESAAQALFDRILANEEIHLLGIEAYFLKGKAPRIVLDINYYE